MERTIKLDKYDTVRLLIPKLWEHKDVPKLKDESISDYSKRVFAFQAGIDLSYMTDNDVRRVWVEFSEFIFGIPEYHSFLGLVTLSSYEPVQAIICIIQTMRVLGRFELDKTDIKSI